MSRTTLSPAYRALALRSWRESIPRPVKPSDRRRLQSAADSCEDDVPTPEEIDPSLLDRFDCDHDPDCAHHDLDECTDDGHPYCDAP